MRFSPALAGALLLAVPAPLLAQLDAPVRNPAIVVTGKRLLPNGKPIAMSDWRVAETQHVLFYARADEKEVARIAGNLERLHFLLSVLLNRVGREDNAIRVSVVQVGDGADFRNLRLGHARWQEGPFPNAFPGEYYYDPRDDGPVLATTREDLKIVLERGRDLAHVPIPPEMLGQMLDGTAPVLATISPTVESMRVNEISFDARAEGRLYSGFAQNYLLTYFPAAYPRWYLDGFGEMFATFDGSKEGTLEYGRAPDGFAKVMEWYGRYRLADVLSGKYLTETSEKTDWTPYHAWALVHLLFFSDEWKRPLHDYLAAIARGAAPAEAATALGDLARIEHQLASYRGSKVPYETLTYPAGRFGDPLVRQLTRDQADFVKRRLVLGSRVEIAGGPDDPQRAEALQARAKWVADLGQDAVAEPRRLDLQLLAAEAACRSEIYPECRTAADRALAIDPSNGTALAWKGIALAATATSLAPARRAGQLGQARVLIARANKLDTEAVLPLLAYYRSFTAAGVVPPDLALLGLVKASGSAPAAPETRLQLGAALAGRGNAPEARDTLLPIAHGPYETPERPEATEILSGLEAAPPR